MKEKALQLGRGRVLNVRGSCKEMCLTVTESDLLRNLEQGLHVAKGNRKGAASTEISGRHMRKKRVQSRAEKLE